MAGKVGQIIARGDRRWFISVSARDVGSQLF
jgi:hypothetical protein